MTTMSVHPFVPTAGPDEPVPFTNPDLPPELTAGFVVGHCGHRVARSEWAAGFRNCERCGDPPSTQRRCACGEPVVDTDECDRCFIAGDLEYERRMDQ